jgi:hypothetical protein
MFAYCVRDSQTSPRRIDVIAPTGARHDSTRGPTFRATEISVNRAVTNRVVFELRLPRGSKRPTNVHRCTRSETDASELGLAMKISVAVEDVNQHGRKCSDKRVSLTFERAYVIASIASERGTVERFTTPPTR